MVMSRDYITRDSDADLRKGIEGGKLLEAKKV